MESRINQRIKLFLDGKQISLNALAKKLNMNQSTILRQVKGEQTLAAGVVEKFLLSFPEVSAEWLLRGEGDMYKPTSPTSPEVQSPCPSEPVAPSVSDSEWKAKYEELEKRYDQLLSMLCGRQSAQPLSSVG